LLKPHEFKRFYRFILISAFICLTVHLHSLSVLPKPDIEKNWWTVQVSKPAQESAGAAGAEACEQAR
jgi:hypothetical protein